MKTYDRWDFVVGLVVLAVWGVGWCIWKAALWLWAWFQ